MFGKFTRRATVAGATAAAMGAALIPSAAAQDFSKTINDSVAGFLWDLLNTVFWIPAGISMELGIFNLLENLSL